MSDTEIHVKGLAALQKALDELPAKLEVNIMRAAMAAGARVISKQAKQICPIEPTGTANDYKRGLGWTPGALQKSIRVSSRLKGNQVIATVKAGNKQAYYAHMVEFGTAAHWIKPKNKKALVFGGVVREKIYHPGSRKNPFMRIAMDAEAQRALEAVGERIRTRLAKEGINVPDTATGDTS